MPDRAADVVPRRTHALRHSVTSRQPLRWRPREPNCALLEATAEVGAVTDQCSHHCGSVATSCSTAVRIRWAHGDGPGDGSDGLHHDMDASMHRDLINDLQTRSENGGQDKGADPRTRYRCDLIRKMRDPRGPAEDPHRAQPAERPKQKRDPSRAGSLQSGQFRVRSPERGQRFRGILTVDLVPLSGPSS
jgi:hypothetical protein